MNASTRWRFVAWAIAAAAAAMLVVAPNAQAQKVAKIGAALNRADSARVRSRDDSRYDEHFKKYSKRYFGAPYDWRYFKAQGMAESELNADAKSYVGARGIMQLMPATFALIAAKRSDFRSITDPENNIAAGIMHDRWLWTVWSKRVPDDERHRFMFGSYNAGEGPIQRAWTAARTSKLSEAQWTSIELVAPKIERWRYRETLGYVKKIDANYAKLKKSR